MDKHDFEDNSQSHDRFNKSLNELFPKKYHRYAKKDSTINLFQELRCGMIHKLSPLSSRIRLTERKHLQAGQEINMTEINDELYLVLEDIYEDLHNACEKLKKLNINKKLPTKKMEKPYLDIRGASTTKASIPGLFS